MNKGFSPKSKDRIFLASIKSGFLTTTFFLLLSQEYSYSWVIASPKLLILIYRRNPLNNSIGLHPTTKTVISRF